MMQNSCDILITNAAAVIPRIGILQTNIMIENGKIKTLIKSIDNIHASKIINANGKYVLPGLIDPHIHYGVYTPIDEAAKSIEEIQKEIMHALGRLEQMDPDNTNMDQKPSSVNKKRDALNSF